MTEKTKSFIEKLKKCGFYDENCDYSLVDYISLQKKVIVVHRDNNSRHLINPANLLKGVKCSYINIERKPTFEQARKFAQKLNLNSGREWEKWHSENKICYMPYNPLREYKNSGWVSMGDFLGTGNISNSSREYLPFDKAYKLVSKLNFKNYEAYRKYVRDNNLDDLPIDLYKAYKDSPKWKGVKSFLGKDVAILPFEEAKKYARALKLDNEKEWRVWHIENRPKNIPYNVQKHYKNDGWVGFCDFLGNGRVATHNKKLLNFEQAKQKIHKLGLRSEKEWLEWYRVNQPTDLPSYLYYYNKDKNWKGMGDMLGHSRVSNAAKEFLSYDECSKIATDNGVTSRSEWQTWWRANKPGNIPARPDRSYKNRGWVSWGEFTNTGRIANQNLVYLSFEEAREFVSELKLKSREEWENWYKDNKPKNIPIDLYQHYKDKGWVSLADFLGYMGNGEHSWYKPYILHFLKSLEKELHSLDSVELLTIINSNKLTSVISKLGFLEDIMSSSPESGKRIDTITKLINKVEESEDTDLGTETTSVYDTDISISEGLDNLDGDILSTKDIIKTMHHYDNDLLTISLDNENIDFLLKNQLKKIWNSVLNGEVDVECLRLETGGEKFTIIKNWFLREYEEVCSLKIPKNYTFAHQPNLMQKLVSYRLYKEKRYGNWSGTGAGKTLAAILAGRYCNAKNTIIICNNSNVDGWVESTLDYFSDSNVYSKEAVYNNKQSHPVNNRVVKFQGSGYNYFIINYEAFQQGDGDYIASEILNNNKIDYVILDEVQSVKQRHKIDESLRRDVINKLLINSAKKNKDLLVTAMSATPVINNLIEPKKLLELLSGKSHDDLKTDENINNGVEMYKYLTRYGLRYKPNYEINLNEIILKTDGSHLIDKLTNTRKGSVVDFEKILLEDKLNLVKDKISKGTLIYTHYVTDFIKSIGEFVSELGLKVGYYTGSDKTGLKAFKAGKIDVLIGSSPISTGVDGIQKVCNKIIPIILPWTSSEYLQLIGRVKRQGSMFDTVDVYLPMVTIDTGDVSWSWDRKRYDIIKYKATLGDLVVDGIIPDGLLPSGSKMMEHAKDELLKWIHRLNGGSVTPSDRDIFDKDFDPTRISEGYLEKRITSELSEFNRRGKTTRSSTMNKEFNDAPDSWYRYHALRKNRMKSWGEIPYEYIATKIKDEQDVIADFGCGENLFKKCIPNNKVYSFDHIAIDETVTACDMRNTNLDNDSIDVAVFSLALWGTNSDEYIKEAYRVLKRKGMIYIAESSKNYESSEEQEKLVGVLNEMGFQQVGSIENRGKFIYLSGLKI